MWKWWEDDLGSGDKWRDETGHCILIIHNFVFSWAFSHCWHCYLWQHKTSYCWYSIDFMLTSQQCKILASYCVHEFREEQDEWHQLLCY